MLYDTDVTSKNPGLKEASKIIRDVKDNGNHITELLSLADLIQLGGYTSIQYCGGPTMNFRIGRKDFEQPKSSNALITTDSTEDRPSISRLDGMELTPQEHVVLMGSYTLGFKNMTDKSKQGRWTMNPYVFDNTYFQEQLLGDKSKYLKTEADLELIANPEFKKWVEVYAEDEERFFEDYA